MFAVSAVLLGRLAEMAFMVPLRLLWEENGTGKGKEGGKGKKGKGESNGLEANEDNTEIAYQYPRITDLPRTCRSNQPLNFRECLLGGHRVSSALFSFSVFFGTSCRRWRSFQFPHLVLLLFLEHDLFDIRDSCIALLVVSVRGLCNFDS